MNLFDLAATLKLNTSEFENGIKSAQMSAAVFAQSMTKGQVDLAKGFTNIGKGMQSVGQNISKFGQGVVKVGKAASVVTAGVGLVLGATFSKAKQFIGTYESAMTVFTRKLAGGKEAAGELYDSLVKVAKGSSFAQEHMVSAGQTLVAMGLDADKTTKYVQAATDAIAGMGGSGEEVEEMATLFAKVSQQTNLYTQDIQQMVERGIPAWDILATKYHTTTDEVKNMASKGLLPAKESLDTITDALEESDEASEMFKYSMHGLAAELKSGTLTGTLDSLNTSFRTFSLRLLDLDPRTESGKKNIEKLNKAISKFGEVLEKIGEKFGKVLGRDLVNGLDAVTNCLENFNNALDNMSPEQAEAIVHAIEAIALAGPALIVVGTAIKGVGGAISGIGTMFTWLSGAVEGASGAWAAFAGAVGGAGAACGVIAAAIVAVIAVVVALKRHWNDVVKYFKSFNLDKTFSRLSKTTSEVMGKFKKLGDLMEVIGVIIGAVLMPIVTGFMALTGSLIQVFDGLMTAVGGAIDILAGFGELIIGTFTGDGEKIQQAWDDIWNGCLDALKGTVKAIIGVFDSSGLFNGLLFEPLVSSTIQFSDTVSEESQRAVQAYMDLDKSATNELNQLYWSATEITEDTKNSICKKYDDMADYIIRTLNQQKDDTVKVFQDILSKTTTLTEDEKTNIIKQVEGMFDENAKKVTDGNKRIKEIMDNAAKEKRQITEDEKKEINRIQEEMKNVAVSTLSKSESEQLAILQDLKNNAGKLSLAQCTEAIKHSQTQKDETIKNAKEEYEGRLAAAQNLRTQGGTEAEELANKIEKEAKRQYDVSVTKARDTHNDVVKEAQKQAKEHGAELDSETGDVISAWDKMWGKSSNASGNITKSIMYNWSLISSDTNSTWGDVSSDITSSMNTSKKNVADGVSAMKSSFDTKFPTPHIPVPVFTKEPSDWTISRWMIDSIKPSFQASWHAKGAIFTKPTLFPTPNGIHGVGEAGAEAVLPIKVLKDYVRGAMAEGVREAQIAYKDSTTGKANAGMVNALLASLNANGQEINVYIGGKQIASEIYDPLMDIMKKKEVRVGA